MELETGHQGDPNRDYTWLLREATWREFWFALDQVVDWIKKREEIEKLHEEKQKN
jgi:hypothetical protein